MNATRTHLTGHILGGRYMLLSPVAHGGMGEVWKARDQETAQVVAAKVLRPELTGQQASLTRFRTEARNAMRVQHPNIASVLDSGEDHGRGWIIMELVDGRPLTDYLAGGTRLAVADVIPLLIQVAMALEAAGSAGVVHRDIKPANILVRPDGVAKLTDFGISRSVGQETMTAAGMVMGTAQYLPPEQAMGHTATTLGDLYALGVIAYECVAGHRPFTGPTQVDIAFAHVNDPVPPLPQDVPAPFAQVVMRLLQKDPAKRFQSGLTLAKQLAGVARELNMSVQAHPLPEIPATASANPESSANPATPAGAPVAALDDHSPANTGAAPAVFPPTRRTHEAPAPAGAPVTNPDGAVLASGNATPPSGPRTVSAQATDGGAFEQRRARERDALMAKLNARARLRQAQDAEPSARPVQVPTKPRTSTTVIPAITPEPGTAPGPNTAPEHPPSLPSGPSHTRETAPQTPGRPRRRRVAPTAPPARAVANPAAAGTPPQRRSVRGSSSINQRNARRQAPAWHPVRAASVKQTPTRAPQGWTKYNRSQVDPPRTRQEQFGRAAVITLIIVTILLIAYAIMNRYMGGFGALTPTAATIHHCEEALTWLNPWIIA